MRCFVALLIVLMLPLTVEAHRSGCHRWHSCPSDSGSYICGDTGHCSQCPDNQFCKDRSPRSLVAPIEEKKPQKPTVNLDYHEADYRDYACPMMQGQVEYPLADGSRVDCLTDEYAIELDYARKWAEAIGQSLYYGAMTGKKPAILLILESEKEKRHLVKIEKVMEQYGLDIKIWTIEPEALVDGE